MALGGGAWNTQNKVLPGSYINFSGVSTATATLSDRGYVAMPLVLDWGATDEVFTVTNAEFQTNCLAIFGRNYTDNEMLPLRELFQNASTVYIYRLNGGGTKAGNTFCNAKYTGIAGNNISIVIAKNVDDESLFEVSTMVELTTVDTQTVANASGLMSNDYVDFIATAELEETVKTPLTGGTNGTVTTANYQRFLDKIESYSFNTLGCPTADTIISSLFVNFTKRMRDEVGAKFQTIIYSQNKIADYEGVIELSSKVINYDATINGLGDFGLVYWVTGAEAGCLVNATITNKAYDGEFDVDVSHTQTDLENFIVNGNLVLHNVNGTVRVLEDISSLTTVTTEKTDVFKSNQTMRVIDQIGNDIAVLFGTKYLGTMPNDNAGRISLWNDVCKLLQSLEQMRAIEGFDTSSVQIEQGDTKKAVLCKVSELNIVNAMSKLYMSVEIS